MKLIICFILSFTTLSLFAQTSNAFFKSWSKGPLTKIKTSTGTSEMKVFKKFTQLGPIRFESASLIYIKTKKDLHVADQ